MSAVVLLWRGSPFADALVRSITVMVIACPCALGIATPLARVAAFGKGRRQGLLVRDADALERAASLSVIVLDKTGTATVGDYHVLDVRTWGSTPEAVLARAASVGAGSDHPAGRDASGRQGRLDPGSSAGREAGGYGGRRRQRRRSARRRMGSCLSDYVENDPPLGGDSLFLF